MNKLTQRAEGTPKANDRTEPNGRKMRKEPDNHSVPKKIKYLTTIDRKTADWNLRRDKISFYFGLSMNGVGIIFLMGFLVSSSSVPATIGAGVAIWAFIRGWRLFITSRQKPDRLRMSSENDSVEFIDDHVTT